MPHKQNPILAELLVTLSRYNAVQLGGMHQALIHEQERSGASWALEWMILPAMLHCTTRGLSAAQELLTQVGNHWRLRHGAYGAIIGVAFKALSRGATCVNSVPCSNQLFGAAAPHRV